MQSPNAKRLYRFLDKRFYHGKSFEMDLRDLAVNRMGLSSTYNAAQLKQGIQKGLEELEQRWDLRPLSSENQFLKIGCRHWSIRFERKRRLAIPIAVVPIIQPPMDFDPTQLQFALTKRSIGPASAEELSQTYPA